MKCKCKECGQSFEKKLIEIIRDISAQNRRPLYCEDCNRNNVWKKTNVPSSQKTYSPEHRPIPSFNGMECPVTPLNIHIREFLESIIKDPRLLCEVTYKDGQKQFIFPDAFEHDYVLAHGDAWYEGLKDKAHEPNSEQLRIPLYKIDKMEKIDRYRDYHESDPDEPMYGYKAMMVDNGAIEDGYQIGVMKEKEKQDNPYYTDYERCYLHYCKNIEDPLLVWERDYIANSMVDPVYPYYHLFYVKAEGHYRQNTKYGWVANKLTLLREVSPKEIIEYYEQNPALLQQLKSHWATEGRPDNIWEQYKTFHECN